jgi:intracellular multiplication protein IcmD
MRKNKFLMIALGLIAGFAFATETATTTSTTSGLGAVAQNVKANIEGFATLITSAAYIAGLGFFMMGVLKFKAYKENPQQTPLSQPIMMVVIGAALFYLPSLITTAGATLFGANASAGEVSGFSAVG